MAQGQIKEICLWQTDCLCSETYLYPHAIMSMFLSRPGKCGFGKINNLCGATAENAMFRITVVESLKEEKWILQGQLTGEFASELSAHWQQSQDRCSDLPRVVDLRDVTVIDKTGEEILLMMIHQQAKFIATGFYTRHLLEELKGRTEGRVKTDI